MTNHKFIYISYIISLILLSYKTLNHIFRKMFYFFSIDWCHRISSLKIRQKRWVLSEERENKKFFVLRYTYMYICTEIYYHDIDRLYQPPKSLSFSLSLSLCLPVNVIRPLLRVYVAPYSSCKCIIGVNRVTLSESAGESRLPIESVRRWMKHRQEAASTMINCVASRQSFRDQSVFKCK